MKHLEVYLAFPGTCREAMHFYKEALNGEIAFMQTFGEAPINAPDSEKDLIMHAHLVADGMTLMASDGNAQNPVTSGNNVSLSLSSDNAEEVERMFNALSEGGTVTMPLQKTFWSPLFGMLTDRYGINWMVMIWEPGQQ